MLLSALLPPKAAHTRFGPLMRADDPRLFLRTGSSRGYPGKSGVVVNEHTAMGVSAVFASARNIAQDVAKLSLILYRRLENGGNDRADDVPLSQILRLEPNPEMGSYLCRSSIILSAALWGRGCGEIERNGDGTSRYIWPIEPWRVQPKRDDLGVYFEVTRADGSTKEIRDRDMIHIRGLSNDGVVGFMTTRLAEGAIGMALAAAEFTAAFFANGMAPSGIVTLKNKAKPEQLESLRDQFAEKYSGAANSGKPIVLDNESTFTATTMDSEKGQRVETMRFSVEEIARYWRMPPHKLFDMSRAQGWSTLESSENAYHTDTLLPWLKEVEEEYTRKLLGQEERKSLFIEHMHNSLMRVDAVGRSAFYNAGIQGGWLCPNEVRTRENMNPYPGGDQFRVQQNMAMLDKDGKPLPANGGDGTPPAKPAAPPADEDPQREQRAKVAMMPVLIDAAARMLDREAKAIATKAKPDGDWLTKFYAGHRDQVAAAMAPPLDALSRLVGQWAVGLADRYATEHVNESMRRLQAGESPTSWMVSRPAEIAARLIDEVCHEADQ